MLITDKSFKRHTTGCIDTEAVEKLINDNKARVRMGESAKLKSVDFDHKKSISTIIDIYKNLLSGQA